MKARPELSAGKKCRKTVFEGETRIKFRKIMPEDITGRQHPHKKIKRKRRKARTE